MRHGVHAGPDGMGGAHQLVSILPSTQQPQPQALQLTQAELASASGGGAHTPPRALPLALRVTRRSAHREFGCALRVRARIQMNKRA